MELTPPEALAAVHATSLARLTLLHCWWLARELGAPPGFDAHELVLLLDSREAGAVCDLWPRLRSLSGAAAAAAASPVTSVASSLSLLCAQAPSCAAGLRLSAPRDGCSRHDFASKLDFAPIASRPSSWAAAAEGVLQACGAMV